jgi:nicotinamidase-related amidase
MDSTVDRASTAVLLMDLQNEVLEMLPYADRRQSLLANAWAVLEAARAAKLAVFHIVVQFEAGYPEVNPRNKSFSGLKAAGRLQKGSAGAAVSRAVAPVAGESVVTKVRVGAFSTTNLETLLRARGISHLVLAGYATSGVVLSTVRWAADMDYALTVVADACADADEEVHRVLTEKVFPRQATVLSTQQFKSLLGAG